MRDLQADRQSFNVQGFYKDITVFQVIEYLDRAIAAETQIEKMKCCWNCKLYNDCSGEWEDNVCGNWEIKGGRIMDEISDNEISTMLKLVAMGETDLIPNNKLSAALQELKQRASAAEAEVDRLRGVLNERIADINTVLDDNESHRAMKLATDLAFMEQRKQMEKYRQALNRVLGFVVDCPSHQGLKNGIDKCDNGSYADKCGKCWKIALGVEE